MKNKEVNFEKVGLKSLVCIAVVCFQLLVFSSFAQPTSGTTGSLTWSLNLSDSTLTIKGNDAMPDYNRVTGDIGSTAPWNAYRNSIAAVIMENKVKSIGNYAFLSCYNLRSIAISDSVTTIGDWAFGYCFGLRTVIIPDLVIMIGERAFTNCASLTSVIIGNSVTMIREDAFSACLGLTSIIIPNSVTTIKTGAFGGCTNLTSVTIGNSVTTVKDGAFSNCGLTSVIIPNSVITIGSSAFSRCDSLRFVSIGNSVATIGREAFGYCENIDTINCNTSIPPITEFSPFSVINIPIYVPCGSIAAYQTAHAWKDFTNYQAIGGTPLPEKPDNIAVLQKDNALDISWESAGAVRYEIYRNNTLLATTTSTTYRDSNLTNNVNYCYKINAVGDSCVSGLSAENCKKFTSNVGITNYELEITNYVKIYPNPTTGQLQITNYELRENMVIEIFSVVGQIVGAYRIRPEANETIIDISHLTNGLYFLKIDNKVFKIIKQ